MYNTHGTDAIIYLGQWTKAVKDRGMQIIYLIFEKDNVNGRKVANR